LKSLTASTISLITENGCFSLTTASWNFCYTVFTNTSTDDKSCYRFIIFISIISNNAFI